MHNPVASTTSAKLSANKKVATSKELKDKEFTQWFLEHPLICEELVFGERIHKNCLPALYKIWFQEEKKLEDLTLMLALGASMGTDTAEEEIILSKYHFYKSSHKEKKLFPQFEKLAAWEMALLYHSREDVEELLWGQDYLANKEKIKPDNIGREACGLIPYRSKNAKGVSIHKGAAFYDYKPVTLPLYIEYGGVCGSVSTGASIFARCKGVPSYTIGQPGHCALLWKGEDGQWKIGNNIYGWNWSHRGDLTTPWGGHPAGIYTLSRFINSEKESIRESNLCYYYSFLSKKRENVTALLAQAVKKNPDHLLAWKRYAEIELVKGTEQKKIQWVKEYRHTAGNDPMALKTIVNTLIPEKSRKKLGYDYCALLLTEDESTLSRDIFMEEFWKLAKGLSEIKKGIGYTPENKSIFFKKWVEQHKKNPASQNLKIQTGMLMESAICSLLEHEKTCSQFLETYRQLLEIWNDGKMTAKAETVVASCLEKCKNEKVRHKLIAEGLELATLLKDRKKVEAYASMMQ